MLKKFAATIATGALALSVAQVTFAQPGNDGGGGRKAAMEHMMKKIVKSTEGSSMSKMSNPNAGGTKGMSKGLKKGLIKHIARTTQKCADDVAAGKTLSARCKVLQEFKDLMAVCKAEKDAGAVLTDNCKKIARMLGETKKSKSSQSSSATSASETSNTSTSSVSSAASTTSASTTSASSDNNQSSVSSSSSNNSSSSSSL